MSKYFTYEGDKMLACPCCGTQGMQDSFLKLLDGLREEVGHSLRITSGYRCPAHNRDVGGSENSSHMKGLAVDVSCNNSATRMTIVRKALGLGYSRVGISDNFIHVDNDRDSPQNVMWVY